MSNPVKLDDIIEGLEFQSDETACYLNKKTGEVVMVTDEAFQAAEDDESLEGFPDWQHENIQIAKGILETEDYLALPSKFDIHEYAIMERFCLSITDEEIREKILRLIKGKGAFRRFKDNMHRFDIAEDWNRWREEAFKQIAVDWCKENGIEFTGS